MGLHSLQKGQSVKKGQIRASILENGLDHPFSKLDLAAHFSKVHSALLAVFFWWKFLLQMDKEVFSSGESGNWIKLDLLFQTFVSL